MLDTATRRRGIVTASAIKVRVTLRSRATAKWLPYQASLMEALQDQSKGAG